MKKKIIISILTLLTTTAFSQFFPAGEAVWSKYSSDVFGTTRYYQYIQTGDTLINDDIYNKLYFSLELWDNYADTIIYGFYKEYKGAVRPVTSEHKVYFIPKDSMTEVLLYNFNLEIGDTIPVWHDNFSHPITVKSIDTMIVSGKSLRRFEMGSYKSVPSDLGDAIIEGIGSIKELLYIENYLEGIHDFKCFWNKEDDFTYPENCSTLILSTNTVKKGLIRLTVSPNPCSAYFAVSSPELINEDHWIDLVDANGNLVLHKRLIQNDQKIDISSQTKGIYLLMIYNNSGLVGKEIIVITE